MLLIVAIYLINTFFIIRVTIASYGVYYRNFFRSSDSKAFSTLGNLMYVGTNIIDGLTNALTMRKGMHGYDVPPSSQDLFGTFLDIAGPLDMSMEGPRPRPEVNIHLQTTTKVNVYPVASRGNWRSSSTCTSTSSNTKTREQLFASSCYAAYFYKECAQ
ncbi:hypothetical protein E2C01_053669 [Portunus trituberculatus]|uniref:Uncharacterized protein n=1 Tax=Portunus trituberculatus TaxID=210409 RepID=A0A5B7GQR0_PORTR|nr:hypothetical protein [Portunus trituberculatus]